MVAAVQAGNDEHPYVDQVNKIQHPWVPSVVLVIFVLKLRCCVPITMELGAVHSFIAF